MVNSADASPSTVSAASVDTVLSSLERFPLGAYVDDVRTVGRMALDAEVRRHAAALYRRVRDAALVDGLPDEAAATLRFAQAVLKPQWSMQLPGGKRYETYTNGSVLDWVVSAGGGDDDGLLPVCAHTVHRKGRSWHRYEMATLGGTTLWNQVDVSRAHVERRVRLLEKLVRLTGRLGWGRGPGPTDLTTADLTWPQYACEPAGDHALEYLTTLPQTTQHDEVGFLMTIHIGECCFAAMAACVGVAAAATRAGDAATAAASLDRAKPFADAFDLAFAALGTMPPEHFRRFVAATGQASAVQSRRYQHLEILLYGLHPAKLEALRLFPELDDLDTSASVPLSRLLVDRKNDPAFDRTITAAQRLDSSLYRWRARHLGASNRLYPFSGLELGSGYLESHYSRRLEPEGDQGRTPHR